jgi:hypothetical protein
MLNEELIKHEQMSINKSMKTSQLISDTNIDNNIPIQMSHVNLNENANFNDEAKNNNNMFSSLNNFDIILLKVINFFLLTSCNFIFLLIINYFTKKTLARKA